MGVFTAAVPKSSFRHDTDDVWYVAAEYSAQQTDVTVRAAPGVGKRIWITNLYINVGGAVDVTLEQGGAVLLWAYYGSGTGDGVAPPLVAPIPLDPNTSITITTSAAVRATIAVGGYITDA